jgi:predicted alpha/beta-hydrolase family hydrolase
MSRRVARIAPFAAPGLRGYLHRPQSPVLGGLVLTHGAGADCTAPLLVATAEAFAAAGLAVLRCDLPFRQRRAAGPPGRGDAATDQAGLRAAAMALRALAPGRVFLGGHSYGGRQASLLAAEEPGLAEALLLLSYPLHPPHKPAQLRTAHFPRLRTPALFVHGPADPFATAEELGRAIAAIAAPTRVVTVEGAGHDLRRGRFDLAPVVGALLEFGARAQARNPPAPTAV